MIDGCYFVSVRPSVSPPPPSPGDAEPHLEVGFRDAADGVDVGTAAVIFGHIPPQGLVDVSRAENQESSGPVPDPESQLGEQVGQHHPQPSLEGWR